VANIGEIDLVKKNSTILCLKFYCVKADFFWNGLKHYIAYFRTSCGPFIRKKSGVFQQFDRIYRHHRILTLIRLISFVFRQQSLNSDTQRSINFLKFLPDPASLVLQWSGSFADEFRAGTFEFANQTD
jgi:hypothetical protein